MKKLVSIIVIALAGCSTQPPVPQAHYDRNGEPVLASFKRGGVVVKYTLFGNIKSVTSTGVAAAKGDTVADREEAVKVAELRAKSNLIRFIHTDTESADTTETVSVNGKIEQVVIEQIHEYAGMELRGVNISKLEPSDGGRSVTATATWSPDSRDAAKQLEKEMQ